MPIQSLPLSAALSDCTALVVDDDDFSRQAMVDTLKAVGIGSILTATDGRVALQLMDTLDHAPELLVCDLYMPNMDGVEFVEVLARRSYAGGVVIVTGVDPIMLEPVKVMAQYKALNVLGAFVKPLSIESLQQALVAPAA